MEPWDGPASIAFTDGTVVGAVLDRNGLRPSRYYVTKDDLVIMASEVGVLDMAPENVLEKRRLEPGRMFLVDTAQGRIIADEEIKQDMADEHPYQEWLDEHLVELDDLPDADAVPAPHLETVTQRQQAFGYTFEHLRMLMAPMARDGVEPMGAMGNDAPHAVLSDMPQLLYNYFRQLFAQVTNPPIDSIREELVTATDVMMGTELNLLDPQPESCRQIRIKTPMLTNADLAKIRQLDAARFPQHDVPHALRPAMQACAGLEAALEAMFAQVDQAIADGTNVFILSDRGIGRDARGHPGAVGDGGAAPSPDPRRASARR